MPGITGNRAPITPPTSRLIPSVVRSALATPVSAQEPLGDHHRRVLRISPGGERGGGLPKEDVDAWHRQAGPEGQLAHEPMECWGLGCGDFLRAHRPHPLRRRRRLPRQKRPFASGRERSRSARDANRALATRPPVSATVLTIDQFPRTAEIYSPDSQRVAKGLPLFKAFEYWNIPMRAVASAHRSALALLRAHHVVAVRRAGTHAFYSLRDPHTAEIINRALDILVRMSRGRADCVGPSPEPASAGSELHWSR